MRPARPADARAVARVHLASFRAAHRGILADSFLAGLDEEGMAARFHRVLENPETLALVAEVGGAIVRLAYAGPSRYFGFPGGEVWSLYVHPGHRRRGFGSALFAAALEALAQRGFAPVWTFVIFENRLARAFYARKGLRVTGARPGSLPTADGRGLCLLGYRTPVGGAGSIW